MPEKQEQKAENKPSSRRNSLTIGIGNQETADRFLAMKNSTYAGTYEEALKLLLDAYEKPGSDEQTAETINGLHQTIDLRNAEIGELQKTIREKDIRISELEVNLEEARRVSNENAEAGLGNQLQLDELRQRTDGAIILKPNPVTAYFLKEMAEKEGTDPGKILERLFMDDLQNPRANNLPYTVSASRIREVMAELRKEPEK
ncbi:MAG: hypothetical protein IKM99_05410 [Bacteroidales bacterium]|nr:hypothetical protein [Bacteroidales bacterium]